MHPQMMKEHMKQFGMKPNRDPGKPMKGQAKVHKVMSEFKHGTLRSSSGAKVTKRSQAVAIAMSEAGLSRKKKKKR